MFGLMSLSKTVPCIRHPSFARSWNFVVGSKLWPDLTSVSTITSGRAAMSIYEPDDILYKPEIPEYEQFRLRIRGYDVALLESFAKYAHRLVMNLNQECNSDCWAMPARLTKAQTFKTTGNKIQSEYDLATCERMVEMEDIPSTLAPILFEVLQTNLPQGVWFTVKEPDVEEDEFRYVPDISLKELRDQIEEIDKAKEDRKKK